MWRKMLRLGLLALATLTPPAFLLAQNHARGIKFERISLEQGLSQSSARRILQDHQGFMWIGTQDGLNRYDGYNFTIYKHDVQDSNSISDNWITSIHESRQALPSPQGMGRDGTLWIGTRGGLNKFNREKEQFTRFVNNPKNPHSLSNNRVARIYEDRSGTLWIATPGGLNKFDREKEQCIRFVHDPNDPHSLSHNMISSIYEDSASRNTLWIGTGDSGLDKFDRDNEQFTHFAHNPKNPNSLSHNYVFAIHEDHTGMLWIGTIDGLNKFDRQKEQFTRFRHDVGGHDYSPLKLN